MDLIQSVTVSGTFYCDGNLLLGAIPDGLGSLSRLGKFVECKFAQNAKFMVLCKMKESLFLFDNEISGLIPKSLAGLSNLKEFQVQQNQLTGSLWEDVAGAWTSLGTSYDRSSLFARTAAQLVLTFVFLRA